MNALVQLFQAVVVGSLVAIFFSRRVVTTGKRADEAERLLKVERTENERLALALRRCHQMQVASEHEVAKLHEQVRRMSER